MDELDRLAEAVAAKLMARNETVAVAESSAGGLLSAALLGVPGASAYYRGGVVVYSAESREQLLGAPSMTAARDGRDRAEWTQLTARDVRLRLKATWGLAESGSAGPTGIAPGRTWVAVSGPVEATKIIETGTPDRQANMISFATATLRLLDDAMA